MCVHAQHWLWYKPFYKQCYVLYVIYSFLKM